MSLIVSTALLGFTSSEGLPSIILYGGGGVSAGNCREKGYFIAPADCTELSRNVLLPVMWYGLPGSAELLGELGKLCEVGDRAREEDGEDEKEEQGSGGKESG